MPVRRDAILILAKGRSIEDLVEGDVKYVELIKRLDWNRVFIQLFQFLPQKDMDIPLIDYILGEQYQETFIDAFVESMLAVERGMASGENPSQHDPLTAEQIADLF